MHYYQGNPWKLWNKFSLLNQSPLNIWVLWPMTPSEISTQISVVSPIFRRTWVPTIRCAPRNALLCTLLGPLTPGTWHRSGNLVEKKCPTKRNRSVYSIDSRVRWWDGFPTKWWFQKPVSFFLGNLWESIIGGSLWWITHSPLDSFILKKSLSDFLLFWQFGSKIESILEKFPNPPLGVTSAELAIICPKYMGLSSFPVVITRTITIITYNPDELTGRGDNPNSSKL